MSTHTLDEIILGAESIRSPRFFNGRLLSSEDLSLAQQASRSHDRQLGRALGPGIAHGLRVSEIQGADEDDKPVLRVTAGLAINPHGDALELLEETSLALIPPEDEPSSTAGDFDDCEPGPSSVQLTGDGAYMLVASPDTQPQGRAPVSGLGNAVAPCNVKETVEGVRFRLVPLGASFTPVSDLKLRNRVAYRCLGLRQEDAALRSHMLDPFAAASPLYGRLAELFDEKSLTACDVPLATLFWSDGELLFVDMNSVRRRIARPVDDEHWSLFSGDRRRSEAEASLHQFEEHITAMLDETSPSPALSSRRADQYFDYLPGGGFLPTGAGRFNKATFFTGFTITESVGEIAFLRSLTLAALHAEPIKTTETPRARIELFTFPGADFVFFLRGTPLVPAAPAGTPTSPPTGSSPTATGSVLAAVNDKAGFVTADDIKSIKATQGSRSVNGKPATLASLESQSDRPFRIDSSGLRSALNTILHGVDTKRQAIDLFVFPHLAVGVWTISALAADGRVGTKSVTVTANHISPATVTLVEKSKGGTRSPGLGGGKVHVDDGFGIDRDRFEGVVIIDKWEDFVRGRKDKPPFRRPPPPIDPPDDMRDTITTVLTDMLARDPSLPIDLEDWTLQTIDGFDTTTVYDEPYAYVEMGNGAAFPIALIPSNASMPAEVPASRGGLPEVTTDNYGAAFGTAIGGTMDTLGYTWTGFVADSLGVSADIARGVMADARTAAADMKSTMSYLPGVSREAGLLLRDAGYNPKLLANATAEEIGRVVGSRMSASAIGRLAGHARGAVPARAWALDGAGLGFTDNQIGTLAAQGIKSLGDLSRETTADAGRVAGLLGVSTATATTLGAAAADVMSAHILAADRGGVGLEGLPFVGSREAGLLAEAGIASIADAGNADSATIARTLGISQEQASAIVSTAVERTLVTKAGLTVKEAQDVITTTGAKTLGGIAGTTRDTLIRALPSTSSGVAPEIRVGNLMRVLGRG